MISIKNIFHYYYFTFKCLKIPAAVFRLRCTSLASSSVTLKDRRTSLRGGGPSLRSRPTATASHGHSRFSPLLLFFSLLTPGSVTLITRMMTLWGNLSFSRSGTFYQQPRLFNAAPYTEKITHMHRSPSPLTYFSFPASLEAYLVYHKATLNPIEINSKTASCWALELEIRSLSFAN